MARAGGHTHETGTSGRGTPLYQPAARTHVTAGRSPHKAGTPRRRCPSGSSRSRAFSPRFARKADRPMSRPSRAVGRAGFLQPASKPLCTPVRCAYSPPMSRQNQHCGHPCAGAPARLRSVEEDRTAPCSVDRSVAERRRSPRRCECGRGRVTLWLDMASSLRRLRAECSSRDVPGRGSTVRESGRDRYQEPVIVRPCDNGRGSQHPISGRISRGRTVYRHARRWKDSCRDRIGAEGGTRADA